MKPSQNDKSQARFGCPLRSAAQSHTIWDGGQDEGRLGNTSSPTSSPVTLHGTKWYHGRSQRTQVPSKQQAHIIMCLAAKRCRDRKEAPEQDRCPSSALELNTGLRSFVEAGGGYDSSTPPEKLLPPKLGSLRGVGDISGKGHSMMTNPSSAHCLLSHLTLKHSDSICGWLSAAQQRPKPPPCPGDSCYENSYGNHCVEPRPPGFKLSR